MELELVVEHTIAKLPKKSRQVLDVGCRAFDFSLAMVRKNYDVVCVEADDEVAPFPSWGLSFEHLALVPESENGKVQTLATFGNGTGNNLISIPGNKPKNFLPCLVDGASITEIGKRFKVDYWDVVKLDCEGSEYGVLLEWPGPIAGQITVEFHEHTGANKYGPYVYQKIINHLGLWYKCIQHEKTHMHGIKTLNYWDSLFVLKELL